MRLLYDLFSIYRGRSPIHGGGVYAKSLLRQIVALEGSQRGEVDLTVLLPSNLAAIDPAMMTFINGSIIDQRAVDNTQELAGLLTKDVADAFYTALPYDLPGQLRGHGIPDIPVVGTIHGLRELDVEFDAHYRSYLRNPLVRARMVFDHSYPNLRHKAVKRKYAGLLRFLRGHVITVSHHTKYQLLVEFPELEANRIEVIFPLTEELYPTMVPGAENDAPVLANNGLRRKQFLLLLSCDRPVKNAYRVIEAMERKRIPGIEQMLVACVGFRPHQIARLKKRYPRAAARCRFLSYVDRNDLDALYGAAFAFLYPSISEGFGYPPLEAMRNGTPVVASPLTAISEVCGDAVLYANPYSTSELAARIARLIAEPDLRRELAERGAERSRLYENEREHRAERFLRYVERVT